MFSPDQNSSILQWFAMNARYNNYEDFEGLNIPVSGLLKRLWCALRRGVSRINLQPEPLVRPPSSAVS